MITRKRSLVLFLLITAIGFSMISCAGDVCLDNCVTGLQNCESSCDDRFPLKGLLWQICRHNNCWQDYQDCSYLCLATE